jgi:Cft2 family RNA processing exonuclease
VSHAHSDHAYAIRKGERHIIASKPTFALAGVDESDAEEAALDGIRIEMLPSGHMLGSRQLRVEWDSQSFTYTGDMKLSESLTAERTQVKETDYLLLEGTFGNPRYKFPERGEIYERIASFVSKNYNDGHIVLLGGYALGKAQELVAIVNRFCGLKPIVNERIHKACEVYSRFGVKLEAACAGSEEAEELMKSNFVAVLPFHQVNFELAVKLSKVYRRSVYTAVATGWALTTRFPVDEAFPLSDHADFDELMEYVELAHPKRIYCCHGNEELLSRELIKKGYDARPATRSGVQLCTGGAVNGLARIGLV